MSQSLRRFDSPEVRSDGPRSSRTPPVESFLVDLDRLRTIASTAALESGLTWHRERRVLEVQACATRLQAVVECHRQREVRFCIVVAAAAGGRLSFECPCSTSPAEACGHAVAALLHYTGKTESLDRRKWTNALAAARLTARRARVQSARKEIAVELVLGQPTDGVWSAWSLAPLGGVREEYRVRVFGVNHPANECDCQDFECNQLGTCAHIEAVGYQLTKRMRRGLPAKSGGATPALHLDWSSCAEPSVRLSGEPIVETAQPYVTVAQEFRRPTAKRVAAFRAETEGRVWVSPQVDRYVSRQARQATLMRRQRTLGRTLSAHQRQIPGFRGTLLPHQVEGAAFLASTERALLADDMGLGKTVQALAACQWLRGNGHADRVLVVCPASLKQQWESEIRQFTDADVRSIFGPRAERHRMYGERLPYTVVNYALVRRDWQRINESLQPDIVVVDEAQRVRNRGTQTAATVKRLQSDYLFALTGTPLENRLDDFHSVMELVDPHVLGPWWRFEAECHVEAVCGRRALARGLADVRRKAAPVMLRRPNTILADKLPPNVVHRVRVPCSPQQLGIQRAALSRVHAIIKVRSKRPLSRGEELELIASLNRARRAGNALGLIDGHTQEAPKLRELGNLLEELCQRQGRKVVVFSEWETMTRLASRVTDRLGLGYVRLHGKVLTARRAGLIRRFSEDPAVSVFFATDAGSVGLNLQAASVLINLDLPWNPAVLDQRIARIHRYGQTQPTQVYLIVSAGFEGRVERILERKRALFDAVMSDGPADLVDLTDDSLADLMKALVTDDSDVAVEELTDNDEDARQEPTSVDRRRAKRRLRPTASAISVGRYNDGRLRELTRDLTERLGASIQRITVTASGVVVIVEPLPPNALELGQEFSEDGCPCVLVAPGSPLVSDVANLSHSITPEESTNHVGDTLPCRLARASRARQLLVRAERLATQGCHREALEQASLSLRSVTELILRQSLPKGNDGLAAWLYVRTSVEGGLRPELTAAVIRAHAVATATPLPVHMLALVLEDARDALRQLGKGGW